MCHKITLFWPCRHSVVTKFYVCDRATPIPGAPGEEPDMKPCDVFVDEEREASLDQDCPQGCRMKAWRCCICATAGAGGFVTTEDNYTRDSWHCSICRHVRCAACGLYGFCLCTCRSCDAVVVRPRTKCPRCLKKCSHRHDLQTHGLFSAIGARMGRPQAGNSGSTLTVPDDPVPARDRPRTAPTNLDRRSLPERLGLDEWDVAEDD